MFLNKVCEFSSIVDTMRRKSRIPTNATDSIVLWLSVSTVKRQRKIKGQDGIIEIVEGNRHLHIREYEGAGADALNEGSRGRCINSRWKAGQNVLKKQYKATGKVLFNRWVNQSTTEATTDSPAQIEGVTRSSQIHYEVYHFKRQVAPNPVHLHIETESAWRNNNTYVHNEKTDYLLNWHIRSWRV